MLLDPCPEVSSGQLQGQRASADHRPRAVPGSRRLPRCRPRAARSPWAGPSCWAGHGHSFSYTTVCVGRHEHAFKKDGSARTKPSARPRARHALGPDGADAPIQPPELGAPPSCSAESRQQAGLCLVEELLGPTAAGGAAKRSGSLPGIDEGRGPGVAGRKVVVTDLPWWEGCRHAGRRAGAFGSRAGVYQSSAFLRGTGLWEACWPCSQGSLNARFGTTVGTPNRDTQRRRAESQVRQLCIPLS